MLIASSSKSSLRSRKRCTFYEVPGAESQSYRPFSPMRSPIGSMAQQMVVAILCVTAGGFMCQTTVIFSQQSRLTNAIGKPPPSSFGRIADFIDDWGTTLSLPRKSPDVFRLGNKHDGLPGIACFPAAYSAGCHPSPAHQPR